MTAMFLARVPAGWMVLPFTEMGRDGEDSKKGARGRGDQSLVDMFTLRYQSDIQVFREACDNWICEPGLQRTGNTHLGHAFVNA